MGLREQMKPLGTTALVQTLFVCVPEPTFRRWRRRPNSSCRSLARRHIALAEEIEELDAMLDELTAIAPPSLLANTRALAPKSPANCCHRRRQP